MTLKNVLINEKAQSVVEYIAVFIVIVFAVFVAFGAFNPEHMGIRNVFDNAVNGALTEINNP